MMRSPFLVAAVFVVLASGFSRAQDSMTVDRAVQEALAHNASLRAARAGSSEAAAAFSAARAAWFPQVSVSESWHRGNQPVFVFSSLLASRQFAAANFAIDALNHPDPINAFQTSIALEQTVFDGGRRQSVIRGASLRRDIAGLGVDEAAANLAVSVVRTFGRLLSADAGGRASAAALEAAREDRLRAERRRDMGMATDADVLALTAHVAALDQRSIQSQADVSIARAELNRLMGAPIDRDYRAVEPAGATVSADARASLDSLLAEADRARPELRRGNASTELADTGRARARSALLPQLAAQAGVEVNGTQFADRASSWIVGAAVRWNFSLGGADLAELKAAADSSARARAEAEETRAAVHVEVLTAFRRLEAARARQAAGRAALAQARESERIIRDRFDAGLAGVGDVLRASSTVLGADEQRVSALVDAMVADAMLRRAVGRQP